MTFLWVTHPHGNIPTNTHALHLCWMLVAAWQQLFSLHLCKLISHFQVLLFGYLWLFHIFTHHLSIRWRLWQRRRAHLLKAATLILSSNTSDRLHLNAAETTQLSLLWKQGEVLYSYTYPKIHFLHFTVSLVLLSFLGSWDVPRLHSTNMFGLVSVRLWWM